MCLAAPPITGKGHCKIAPKAKHFSHCKKKQSSRPNKTNNSKRLAKISNHAFKNSEKTQIIFIDNMIINPQFIGSHQTHRKKRITSNRYPRISRWTLYWRAKRDKSHIATSYGPVGLWWTTHTSSEDHQWGWWTPLWSCSPPTECRNRALDWISWFWNLR